MLWPELSRDFNCILSQSLAVCACAEEALEATTGTRGRGDPTCAFTLTPRSSARPAALGGEVPGTPPGNPNTKPAESARSHLRRVFGGERLRARNLRGHPRVFVQRGSRGLENQLSEVGAQGMKGQGSEVGSGRRLWMEMEVPRREDSLVLASGKLKG